MDPMTAAMIASAGAQVYTGITGNKAAQSASDKAMEDAAARLARSQGYLSGFDPNSLTGMLDLSYLDQLQPLNIQNEMYRPEYAANIAGTGPEAYQFMNMPEAQQVADSPETRAIQLNALQNLQKTAKEGLTAEDQAQFLKAQSAAGQEAAGREGAIIRNLESRGMGGSGIEAAMRQMASQSSADRLSQFGADRAAADAKQRALGEQLAMSGAGTMRGQDISLNKSNADILNDFAVANSKRQQEILNMNTEARNKFTESETGYKRSAAEKKADIANSAQLRNIDATYNNALTGQKSLNELIQYKGETKNAANKDIYGATERKAQALAGSELNALPGIYAQGAANAAGERALYSSVGSIPETAIKGYGTIKSAQADDEKAEYYRNKNTAEG